MRYCVCGLFESVADRVVDFTAADAMRRREKSQFIVLIRAHRSAVGFQPLQRRPGGVTDTNTSQIFQIKTRDCGR
jgi:hypothetical protein